MSQYSSRPARWGRSEPSCLPGCKWNSNTKNVRRLLTSGTEERCRLEGLLCKHDEVLNEIPIHFQTFDVFLQRAKSSDWDEIVPVMVVDLAATFPVLVQKTCAWTVFHHGLKPTYRVQHDSICSYVHAPIMVVQYFLQRQNVIPESGKYAVGVAQLMNKLVKPSDLWRRVLEGSGGSSFWILSRLLKGIKAPDYSIGNAFMTELDVATFSARWVFDALELHGPALVSKFKVTRAFLDPSRHSYSGPILNDDEVVGYHAMILVGARLGSDGQFWFLLQNCWTDKQFVEVDRKWFLDSGADLHFIFSCVDAGRVLANVQGALLSAEASETVVLSHVAAGGDDEVDPVNLYGVYIKGDEYLSPSFSYTNYIFKEQEETSHWPNQVIR